MYTIDSVNVEIKSLIPRVYHGEMKVVCEDKRELFVYMTYEPLARGSSKERLGLYDKSCLDYFDKPGAKPQEEEDEELRALMNMLDDADPPRLVGYEEYNSFNQTGDSAYRAAYAKLYNLMLVLTPDHEIKVNGQKLNLRFNSARGEIRHLEADYDSHHTSAQSYDAEAEYVDETGGKVCLFVNRISPEDKKDADRLFHRISKGSMQQFLSRQTREDTVLRREQYYKGHFGAPAEVDAEDVMMDNVEAYVLNPMLSLFEEDDYFTQSRVGKLEEISFEGKLPEDISEDAAEQPEAKMAEQAADQPEETSECRPEAEKPEEKADRLLKPACPPLRLRGEYNILSMTIKSIEGSRTSYQGECRVPGDVFEYGDQDIPYYAYMHCLEGEKAETYYAVYEKSCIEAGGPWADNLKVLDCCYRLERRPDYKRKTYYYAYELMSDCMKEIKDLYPEEFTVQKLRIEFVPQRTKTVCYDAEAELTNAAGETFFVYFEHLETRAAGNLVEEYYYRTSKASFFDYIRYFTAYPVLKAGEFKTLQTGKMMMPEIVGNEEFTDRIDTADSRFAPVYNLLTRFTERVKENYVAM
ncbi:MAG: hypothetical protein IJH99_08490 [Eubacterium sp.]|nr:hypothetical protein [Eubacterium sp.]